MKDFTYEEFKEYMDSTAKEMDRRFLKANEYRGINKELVKIYQQASFFLLYQMQEEMEANPAFAELYRSEDL